jgi:RNA polymerase sigma factor (TIGR02999 family)
MDGSPSNITLLLMKMKGHQQDAAPRLFELLYNELRRLARRHLHNERSDHTLQATALVHETYCRLINAQQDWRNCTHFFAVASAAMRRILVDHARAKRAAKRPGSHQKVDLDEAPLFCRETYDDVITLDLALGRLSRIDPRQALIVELRYFGGLTADEAAEALGISTITVQRDWAVAKAWLHGELAGRPALL